MIRVCEPLNPPEAHVLQPWVSHKGCSLKRSCYLSNKRLFSIKEIQLALKERKLNEDFHAELSHQIDHLKAKIKVIKDMSAALLESKPSTTLP